MDLIYPINLIGHDDWLESGYDTALAAGDVVTRDGECIGRWAVTGYNRDPDDEDGDGGQFEFTPTDQVEPTIIVSFALVDYRMSRGMALSQFGRGIRAWYDAENPDFPIS